MDRTLIPSAIAGTIALLALSGCAGETDTTTQGPGDRDPYIGSALVLTTADTDLGEIVVDEEGRTVYVFDDDDPGTNSSACDAACLENWPAVISQDDPTGEGVEGDLGTFTREDGFEQVTIDGQPLYYYAGDSASGDVNGQGLQGLWWAVDPDGDRVTDGAQNDDQNDEQGDDQDDSGGLDY
ncbi:MULTISPECIES: hypothetical protein [unclassified Diaminobutyricimonas]|uniref:COG4315 family predicted lipoprotein n=1 Tax=unclassified Diaminobutyricimonas TaxID=2643261 RepID=UPI0012F50562|nr:MULTISPECIES: hypothetical protein [unclassified Diaminobutyricimonas]